MTRRMLRPGLLCLLTLAAGLTASGFRLAAQDSKKGADTKAAADAKKAGPNPNNVKIGNVQAQQKVETARDGWPIHMTYFESSLGKEAPVVVLLHGKGEGRVVWSARRLTQELVKAQFAVVSVDLRKHGESVAPEGSPAKARSTTLTKFDYEAMVAQDLEAVKKFLFDEHQAERLNMRRLAIVGSDFSTVVALNYAALDWAKTPYDDAPTLANRTPRGQDVQALVLLTPAESVTGVGTTKTLPFLRQAGVAALLACGKKNPGDKRAADKIFQQLGGEQQDEMNKRLYQVEADSKATGATLLEQTAQPPIVDLTMAFLKKHVKDADGAHLVWRDRQSRLK